jgi:PAS domain-containing protein
MPRLTLRRLIARLHRAAAAEAVVRAEGGGANGLEATRRELSVFAADLMGAQSLVGQFGRSRAAGNPARERRAFRDFIEATAVPYMVIDPRAGLHIVDVNDAYAAATLTARSAVAGGKLFDVFPDNTGEPDADGVSNLFESIRRAAQSEAPHAMAVQRYDVRDPAGHFVERWWRPVNTPIFDDEGRLLYILHYAGELPHDHPRASSSGGA